MTIVKSKRKIKSSAERKRYASHHKVNSRRYVKIYWPYLPMLVILVAFIGVNSLLSFRPSVLGASSNFSDQAFLNATNADRQSDNESPLTINAQLEQAAQNKADDMVKLNFWSHDSPSGETPWQYITAAGYYYQEAGENLAYGFSGASQVMSAWMSSPDHRANILNPNYQNVGFGVASSPDYISQGPQIVVVAEYAEPAPTSTVTNITFNVNGGSGVQGANSVKNTIAPSASLVSRLQILTGDSASWIIAAVSFITGILVCYFIYRHIKKIRSIIKYGEKFAFSHIFLDLLLIIAIGLGFLLTRTSGFIH